MFSNIFDIFGPMCAMSVFCRMKSKLLSVLRVSQAPHTVLLRYSYSFATHNLHAYLDGVERSTKERRSSRDSPRSSQPTQISRSLSASINTPHTQTQLSEQFHLNYTLAFSSSEMSFIDKINHNFLQIHPNV